MDNMIWLQNWYQNNCDGSWEHIHGIEIGNVDNPGWYIKVDLKDNLLEKGGEFEINKDMGDNDWYRCWTENDIFHGCGDPQKLDKLIEVFRQWVEMKLGQ